MVSGVTRGVPDAGICTQEKSVHTAGGWEGILSGELKNKVKELLRSLAGRQPRHLQLSQIGFWFFYVDMSKEPGAVPFLRVFCGIFTGLEAVGTSWISRRQFSWRVRLSPRMT